MPMELTGIQDVLDKMAAALSSAGDLTVDGMWDAVADLGQRAAERAPVDEGALRGSLAMGVETEGETIVGEVRFTEKYAAVQHERVDFHHPKGGEAKYLEKAALEKAEAVRQKLADAYSDLFGGG